MEFFYDLVSVVVPTVYFSSAVGLFLFGMNCYLFQIFYWRTKSDAAKRRRMIWEQYQDILSHAHLPTVTTQIAVYNEINVVERIMRAAAQIQYPRDKHEIQILDDSTDETVSIIDQTAIELRSQGHDIQVIRRKNRFGYKAGALSEGTRQARGALLAVFDADFLPPQDYFLKTIPFFLHDQKCGFVQARWGHLNRRQSLLTRAQSIGIDGHFMVEQSVRNWNGFYMNFNGTAGLWRKEAIVACGGWQWDTLTEDMDLSYRVQLQGWKTVFLPEVVVPGEIPEDVNAFKSQQFRWAKGSIQTAIKLIPRIMHQPVSVGKKMQALFHMLHYLIHPMMLVLAVLALPVLLFVQLTWPPFLFPIVAALLGFSLVAPSSLYLTSQRAVYSDWIRRIKYVPFLAVFGVGLAVSNSKAVFEAMIGRKTGFVRTPKRGDKEIKRYQIKMPWLAFCEIGLGLYCGLSFFHYLSAGVYLIGPFLGIYSAGYLFIGFLSLSHALIRK